MTIKSQAIFKGYVFALVLDTSDYETKKTLRKKITSNGGTISYLVTNKCHFVVHCQTVGTTSNWGLKTAQKYSIPIVNPHFIDVCLAENKVQAPTTFQAELAAQAIHHLEEQFQKGHILANEQEVRKAKKSLVTKSLKVWEYGDVNGPRFHDHAYKVAKFAVLKGNPRVKGDVPFCVLEIHISDPQKAEDSSSKLTYCVFADMGSMLGNKDHSKYSLTSKASAKTCRFTNDRNSALQAYCHLYKTYTSPPHSMYKWDRHQTIPSIIGSSEFQKVRELWTVSMNPLNDRVQELVGHIWMEAEARLEEILTSKTVDINCTDVDKAGSILLQIRNLLDQNEKTRNENKINDLCHQYFSIIQHKEKPDLSSKQVLAEEHKLLQLVRDVTGVSEVVKGDSNKHTSVQAKYKALGCWIHHLEEKSDEFLKVKERILSSSTNDSKALLIKNIFVVHRPAEEMSFTRDIENHQILFHGSDVCNYVGILSRGLLLDEPEDKSKDTKLGRAIYFSDSASTSASYSSASKLKGTRLMSVVQVALGNCSSTQKRMPQLTAPPTGYDSVWGTPSKDALTSDFQESEFAIFNNSQQKLTHLVEFVFPEDAVSSTEFSPKSQISQDANNNEIPATPTLKAIDALDEFMSTKEDKPIQWGLQSPDTEKIPLKSVHIRARLIDLAAKVVIMQEYKNNSSQNIEAKYVFPLDELAAVCAFEAFINNKHLVGEIEEKQEAHKQYRQAIHEGHGAYLMDEEAPEVFSVSVGNLPADAVVVIKITYVAELTTENGKIRFGLPGSVVPHHKTVSHDTQAAAVDDASLQDLSLHIGIEMPFEIRKIWSPTNNIFIKKTETMATVKLCNGETLREGFELFLDLAEIHVPRMWVETQENEDTEACMLTFYPSFCTETPESGTIILLLDASNSMEKESFLMAQKIALLSLRHLNSNWNFNVILFGSICEELFLVPQPKTAENITSAEDFIMGARANLGCTEPLIALQTFFLLLPQDDDDIQNIFLISDGQITSARPLLLQATNHSLSTRIFTFGVGSESTSCNQHLLKILAKKAAGAFEYFDPKRKSKWNAKILQQLLRASQPVVTDIQIHWQQLDIDATPPIQAPKKLLSLFHGERQVIYGFVPHCTMATLTAKVRGHELSTVVSTSELAKTKGTMLHSLTARAIIRDWSDGILEEDSVHHEAKKLQLTSFIVSLSKQYGLLSTLTSYIAIEKRDKADRNSKKGHSIPELLDAENIDRLSYMEFPREKEWQQKHTVPDKTETIISKKKCAHKSYASLMAPNWKTYAQVIPIRRCKTDQEKVIKKYRLSKKKAAVTAEGEPELHELNHILFSSQNLLGTASQDSDEDMGYGLFEDNLAEYQMMSEELPDKQPRSARNTTSKLPPFMAEVWEINGEQSLPEEVTEEISFRQCRTSLVELRQLPHNSNENAPQPQLVFENITNGGLPPSPVFEKGFQTTDTPPPLPPPLMPQFGTIAGAPPLMPQFGTIAGAPPPLMPRFGTIAGVPPPMFRREFQTILRGSTASGSTMPQANGFPKPFNLTTNVQDFTGFQLPCQGFGAPTAAGSASRPVAFNAFNQKTVEERSSAEVLIDEPQIVQHQLQDEDIPMKTSTARGGLPACSALLHKLINFADGLFLRKIKALLKQGPGPRQSDLHTFQEKLTTLVEPRPFSNLATNSQVCNIGLWQYQAQDGFFTMASMANETVSTQITEHLDNSGLKSIGIAREQVLNMCATIAAIFTFWKMTTTSYPDVTNVCALESSATSLISLDRLANPELLIALVKALVYVVWVHDHHPVLYDVWRMKAGSWYSSQELLEVGCIPKTEPITQAGYVLLYKIAMSLMK